MTPVIHPFGHPSAPFVIKINIGGIAKEGRLRPNRNLKIVGDHEAFKRHRHFVTRRRTGQAGGLGVPNHEFNARALAALLLHPALIEPAAPLEVGIPLGDDKLDGGRSMSSDSMRDGLSIHDEFSPRGIGIDPHLAPTSQG